MTSLLDVRHLTVGFPGIDEDEIPVDDIGFHLDAGEMLALVGESGCGKSLTALALLQLLPPAGRIAPGGTAEFDGRNLLALNEAELRSVRGGQISMVFQDPMTSLNPVYTAGSQIIEAIRAHRKIPKAEARERALALLEEVSIPDPQIRIDQYPHELSGGMRQRS